MINIVPRKRLNLKDNYTYLNRNMPHEEHPPKIHNALLNFFKKKDLHQYPNIQKSYEALSEYLKISAEKLLITRGVEGAIKQVFETFNLKGKTVGILVPTYALLHVYAKAYKVNIIPLKSSAPDYQITIKQIKKILPKIKILFLDNPKFHIPHCFTHQEISEIASLCKIHNVILFLDEVYAGWEYKSYLPNINNHDNVIIASSFSKSGFPSIKTGWLVTNQKLKERLETTRLSYELDYFSSQSLEFLIKNSPYLKIFKKNVLKTKRLWHDTLSKSKRFKVFDSKGYVLRLYSQDVKLVKKTYNNLYANKIVVNLIDDVNLIFDVSSDTSTQNIFFKEINEPNKLHTKNT